MVIINVEFIEPAFGGLDKFQKSLRSIIACVGTLSNYHILECININVEFIQLTFGRLDKFQKLVWTLSNHYT